MSTTGRRNDSLTTSKFAPLMRRLRSAKSSRVRPQRDPALLTFARLGLLGTRSL